jgi:hypothetical protein
MKEPTVREKIQTLHTVEEVEGFQWGCEVLGTFTAEVRNLLEMRRHEINNGAKK